MPHPSPQRQFGGEKFAGLSDLLPFGVVSVLVVERVFGPVPGCLWSNGCSGLPLAMLLL